MMENDPGSTKETGSLPTFNHFQDFLPGTYIPHLSTKFRHNPFITFGDILFTRNDYTQTETASKGA